MSSIIARFFLHLFPCCFKFPFSGLTISWVVIIQCKEFTPLKRMLHEPRSVPKYRHRLEELSWSAANSLSRLWTVKGKPTKNRATKVILTFKRKESMQSTQLVAPPRITNRSKRQKDKSWWNLPSDLIVGLYHCHEVVHLLEYLIAPTAIMSPYRHFQCILAVHLTLTEQATRLSKWTQNFIHFRLNGYKP